MTTTDTIRCHRCNSTDHYTRTKGPHLECVCAACESHIKFLPKDKPYESIQLHFGKYTGQPVCLIEDAPYLGWLLTGFTGKMQSTTREAIRKRLDELNYQTA